MLDQTFSPQNIRKSLKKSDLVKNSLSRDDISSFVDGIAEDLKNPITSWELKVIRTGKHFLYSTDDLQQDFALRILNNSLKRLYKVKQSNRAEIVEQVFQLLKETTPMTVTRLDIKGFYESIDRDSILVKIKNDYLLSPGLKKNLQDFFNSPTIRNTTGLPRGISLSSTLSELAMRSFDRKMQRLDGVYYYARFVDDIVIFSFSPPAHVIAYAKQHLPTPLVLNASKTGKKIVSCARGSDSDRLWTCQGLCQRERNSRNGPNGPNNKENCSFSFLGYQFVFSTCPSKGDKPRNISIRLAPKKVKKIKTRIILALASFGQDKNIDLLEKRIRFLTGNFIRKKAVKNKKGALYAGIFYDYSLLAAQKHKEDMVDLEELTLFLRKALLSCATKFGGAETLHARRLLIKYSFVTGYRKKVLYKFTPVDLKEICGCW